MERKPLPELQKILFACFRRLLLLSGEWGQNLTQAEIISLLHYCIYVCGHLDLSILVVPSPSSWMPERCTPSPKQCWGRHFCYSVILQMWALSPPRSIFGSHFLFASVNRPNLGVVVAHQHFWGPKIRSSCMHTEWTRSNCPLSGCLLLRLCQAYLGMTGLIRKRRLKSFRSHDHGPQVTKLLHHDFNQGCGEIVSVHLEEQTGLFQCIHAGWPSQTATIPDCSSAPSLTTCVISLTQDTQVNSLSGNKQLNSVKEQHEHWRLWEVTTSKIPAGHDNFESPPSTDACAGLALAEQ